MSAAKTNVPAIPVHERSAAAGSFWETPTIDELAARQGVQPVRALHDVMGGWPEEELDDGFEQAVVAWRRAIPSTHA